MSARLPHGEQLPVLSAQFTTGDNVPALNSHSVLTLLRHTMNTKLYCMEIFLNFFEWSRMFFFPLKRTMRGFQGLADFGAAVESSTLFRTHFMRTSQGWMHLAHKMLTQWRLFIAMVHLRIQMSPRSETENMPERTLHGQFFMLCRSKLCSSTGKYLKYLLWLAGRMPAPDVM